jgi:hypothetical protein
MNDSKERETLLNKLVAAIEKMDDNALKKTAAFVSELEIGGHKRDGDQNDERKRKYE